MMEPVAAGAAKIGFCVILNTTCEVVFLVFIALMSCSNLCLLPNETQK